MRRNGYRELTLQIAIISDTHMPRGGRRLPKACVGRLRSADLILHAGDLVQLSVLRELQSYGDVRAVRGNVDDLAGADVRDRPRGPGLHLRRTVLDGDGRPKSLRGVGRCPRRREPVVRPLPLRG